MVLNAVQTGAVVLEARIAELETKVQITHTLIMVVIAVMPEVHDTTTVSLHTHINPENVI